jgi:hypothetical protein
MKSFTIWSTLDAGVVTWSAAPFVESRSVLRRENAGANQKRATTRHIPVNQLHK